MDRTEARSLVERCLPNFVKAGLPPLAATDIADVSSRAIASLWAGMGNVYRLAIKTTTGETVSIVAKRIELPRVCDRPRQPNEPPCGVDPYVVLPDKQGSEFTSSADCAWSVVVGWLRLRGRLATVSHASACAP